MIVGIYKLEIVLPQCHSLKEKRSVLRRMRDRIGQRFNVFLVEDEYQDKWQRAIVGFSVAGSDRSQVEPLFEKIAAFIEELGEAQVVDRYSEIINV